MTFPRLLSSKAYSSVVDGLMQWLIKGFRATLCITGRHSRNYSAVQAKVRDATSDNDALGPTITLMDEIAQMTFNSSQNFAHYYHENIDTLRVLMTFQYFGGDGNDQGIDVRQKAPEIVEHILGELGHSPADILKA
ncbi:hypothetical protein DXG01_003555 [Tephrocybe rancida]|nr:hypothetical protein DXG01_003555 [Tephrocybe rancida]